MDEKKQVQLPVNVLVDYQFENMLKKFIHDVKKSGILEEIRNRKYYSKPSEIKRLKQKGFKK